MAGVSAESNALFVAFRRLVYSFSEQVSKEEQKTIIYIRLYQLKERYKDSTMLEVLSKLEADGVFGPSHPEGLLEIAKDIKRQDLASEVKQFIKKRSKTETKGGLSSLSAALAKKIPQTPPLSPCHHYGGEPESEEDLQLKATIEVTLAQATVLMQQVEKLERAVAGGKAQRERAKEAISEAAQTATALADRLKKARIELGLDVTGKNGPTVTPATNIRAEELQLGVVSHAVPIGASNKYAMQPQSRSLTRIPEKSTVKVDGKSKSNTSIEITEEEEDDDYEKMQSYAVKEETIKAWRMSHFPSASSFGAPESFTPPSLPSRRSEHFGSYPSSTPQMPSIRPRSEIHYPHSPSSPQGLQAPTSKGGHGSNQKRSSVVPSTQTTDSRSPWAQSVNTNSGGGTHTTLTSHSRSNHVVSKLPQRPTTRATTHGIGGSVASNSPRMPHKQTTKETSEGVSIGDKDSMVKRVTHPPPPQLPPKGKSAMSPSSNRSPVPSRKHDSPTLPKKPNHLSRSSADGTATEPERPFTAATKSSQEATGNTNSKQEEESGKVNMVKARLERLEKKASTLKPALTQKPGTPVITPRKKISGSWTLDHNSSIQKESNKSKTMQSKPATLSHTSSASSSTSSLKRSQPAPMSKARLNSSSSEDDAYILLHPSGAGSASASTHYAGDSGFEDVRPLQRLDQDVENVGGESSEPDFPTHPQAGAYTSLLKKKRAMSDQDGYTAVNYTP